MYLLLVAGKDEFRHPYRWEAVYDSPEATVSKPEGSGYFLTNDFRVYTYNRAGAVMSFIPSIQRDCYYQGYIDGYVDSLVMLSTCAGLSGVLQFENVSYGIEPVESASGFQHLIYRVEYNDEDFRASKENYSIQWATGMAPRADPSIPVSTS
ncbi:hypothetical protein JD844_031089 [Phrynosoma platyrhinos]|uniref:Uncharacterized protein n=1 Tax=Phrynosoma platyrhinos TaxID=52577 RepID=A0ABQ7T0T9_PHRPL|nr:hypothetical protein JD844_031089 [Phrynosoma platyrhinos]